MTKTLTTVLSTAALSLISISGAQATNIGLSDSDSSNGIYDIYSSTFDGALSPCTGSSPPQCAFFGGDPPAPRAITVTPNPTGIRNINVLAVAGTPLGSYLDLTLSGGNTSVTINGGVVALPALTLSIVSGANSALITTAAGAGWVFDSGAHTTSVNGLGQAVFQVNLSPAFTGDFSTLGGVVTSCSGTLCGLLGILSLDMVRYQLALQYDPTFTTFTGKFEGQTANNSLIFANLNSVPVPAAAWLFGSALGLLGVARRRSV
jgi:hypothetical protein